jgi:hypothetical protein
MKMKYEINSKKKRMNNNLFAFVTFFSNKLFIQLTQNLHISSIFNNNKYVNNIKNENELPEFLDKALIGILLGDGHLE